MYKGVGVRFADYLIFLKYSMKMKYFVTETKLFHFHRIFKNGGGGGGGEPLWISHRFKMTICSC